MNDDTTHVQDLISAAVHENRPCVLKARTYNIRQPIIIPSNCGLHIIGEHLYGTRLIWQGDAHVMFDRANARDNLVENLTIDVRGSLGTCFLDTNHNYPPGDARRVPAMIIPSANKHERLRIMGNGRLDVYRHYSVGYVAENNEHHVDVAVHVNEANIGWLINGQQSKYHEMVRCWFYGGATGESAVLARNGSFSWLGGGGSHADVAFFRVTDQTDTISIERADVDGARMFLSVEGPNGKTGSAQPVRVLGGRFMTHHMADTDPVAIECWTAGPLSVQGFQLGSGDQPVSMIAMRGFRGALDVRGCMFGAFGSRPENSIACPGPNDVFERVVEGNVYHHHDGESYVI